jgi:hypothetical protein
MRRIITKRASKRLGVAVVALTAMVQLVPYGLTQPAGLAGASLLFCSFAAVVAIAACNGWLARRSY